MTKIWMSSAVLLLAGLVGGAAGCRDGDPCQRGQTEGPDGLCYLPPNWGAVCENVTDCTGGLFCGAPDLPICTQIDCDIDPEADTICPSDFTCTATGRAAPEPATVCVPRPPTAEECGEGEGVGVGGAGGGGGAGGEAAAPVDGEAPNLGTPCTMENDPVCKGGTVCENEQVHYCVVFSCAEGCSNAAVCAAAGFTCYEVAPAPAGGVCIDI